MDDIKVQLEEIQVLQSIYMDQFKYVKENSFQIHIPNNNLLVQISLSPDYPSAALPSITITQFSSPDIIKIDTTALVKYLLNEAEEMLYNPMIFNLISLVEEKMLDFALLKEEKVSNDDVSEQIVHYTTIEVRKIQEGTPVNKENFIKWHSEFIKSRTDNLPASTRLTGRQLFEQKLVDATIDAEEGDDTFDFDVIDRALFVEVEDLSGDESDFE